VLWKPGFFAFKPEAVDQGVLDCLGADGLMPMPRFPTPGPVHGRPMFAAYGSTRPPSCLTSEPGRLDDTCRQTGPGEAALRAPVVHSAISAKQTCAQQHAPCPSRVGGPARPTKVFRRRRMLTANQPIVTADAQRYFLL